MRHVIRRFVAFVASIVLLLPCVALADAPEQHVYAVIVNGTSVTNGAVILEQPAGTLFVSEDDLVAWGFNLKGRAPDLVFEQTPYYALKSFAGLTTKLDAANQVLSIDAPPGSFVRKVIDVGDSHSRMPAFDGPRGAYLDYNVDWQRASQQNLTSGLFTAGYTGLPGGAVIASDFVYSAGDNQKSLLGRLGTTYRRDDLASNATLRIGDSVTSAGRLGTPAAFIGVQRSTDFSLDPSLLIFPSVNAAGITQAQSTVDVYINGVQSSTQRVAAGPFTVSNLPVIDGQGDVTLVVRDILGREHVIVTPFYYTRSLLKAGLTSSSYEAGVLRRDFGTGFGTYGTGVVSATYRHGFTNQFTGEGHVEATGNAHLVSLAADVLASRIGVFHAAVGESSAGGRQGERGLLGYEYTSRRGFAAFLNGDYQSANFASVGQLPLNADSFTTTAGVRKLFHHGRAVSLALVERHVVGSNTFSSASLGLTSPVGGDGYFGVSLTKAFSSGATGLSVQFSHQIGQRHSVESQAGIGSSQFNRVAYHESLPESGLGVGYDVGVGDDSGAELDAGVYTRTPFGFGRARAIGVRGRDVASDLSWAGGLSFVNGRLHATDTIGGASYGLLELPGLANVRVYVNGRLVGRTNASGEAFLPSLSPYVSNEIQVDARDVPLDVNVDNYVTHVKPYARNATIVRFKVRRSGGVMIHVVGSDGAPLPIGTELTASTGDEPWVVAKDGAAYLRGVRHGAVVVEGGIPGAPCRMTINVPNDTSQLPDLGSQICRSGLDIVRAPGASAGPAPSINRADQDLDGKNTILEFERKEKNSSSTSSEQEQKTSVNGDGRRSTRAKLIVIGHVVAKRRKDGAAAMLWNRNRHAHVYLEYRSRRSMTIRPTAVAADFVARRGGIGRLRSTTTAFAWLTRH